MTLPEQLVVGDRQQERKRAILELVSNYPDPKGIIKERIIDTLTKNGKGSRKTILDAIKVLETDQMLYIHKDKPNSQVHYVRINNKSVLLRVKEEHRSFRESFTQLLNSTEDSFRNLLQNHKIDFTSDIAIVIVGAQVSLYTIFHHFIVINMLYCMLVWPKEVSDKNTLDKVYATVFETIIELQTGLGSMMFNLKEYGMEENMFGELKSQFFVLNGKNLYESIRNLEDVNVTKPIEAVLDQLWKFGFPFVSDALLHFYEFNEKGKNMRKHWMEEIEDWRNEVQIYIKSLPKKERRSLEIISDK